MLAKNRTVLFILTLVLSLALPLIAQAQVDPAEFANQPALTEKDIELFIAFTKFTGEAMKSGKPPEQADIDKIAADNGVTTTRLIYATSKIGNISAIVANPAAKDAVLAQLPDYFKPSDDEIKLVTDHQQDLTAAQTAMMGQ
jgi:hypothetical protein